jgi:hypothetical protein
LDVVSGKDRTSLLPRSKSRMHPRVPSVGIGQTAFSFPIAFLALLSAIKYLAFFAVIIFMTINRVTYPRAFFIYLTGSLLYDDIIIIAVGSVVCATLFYKNKRLLAYSLGMILTPLAVTLAIDNLLPLDVTALICFPGILIAYFIFRKKLDLGKRITRNSVVMTATGILFVIELLSLLTWIVYPSYAPYWDKIFSPSPEWYIAGVEAQLFFAGARLAPAIALIISFSFLVRPGYNSIMQLITGKNPVDAIEEQNPATAATSTDDKGAEADSKGSSFITSDSPKNYAPPAESSSTSHSSAVAGIAEHVEEKQQQALPPLKPAQPLTADELKKLHPNLRARRKLEVKRAGSNPMRANRAFESRLSAAGKVEDRLNDLVVAKTTTRAKSTIRFWLFVSISLIILFSLYPYVASINKDFFTVSVDSGYYVNQINNIKNNGVFSKNGPFSFSSERALSVLLFYGIAAVMPDVPTDVVVAYLPIFLGSFLVFSAYLLIRYGSNSKQNLPTSHFIAPLLVPFSMQFIVGIYGGYFSNMLAISFMLLTLLFYLRFLRSSKMLDLGLFLAMMFMTLFSHVYTWVFLVATLVISTTILAIVKRKTEKKKPHILLISSIAITLAVLLALSSTLTGKSGLDYINGVINTNTGQNFLDSRWFNINNTFRFYLGGFLANTMLMGLAMVWAFKANYKNHFNAVILASIFIFSAFFFLGDEVTQSRIFFNIPLFIPAAIVLSNFITGKYFSSLDSRTRSLIVVLIFLYLGNYALRSLANFYLIVPTAPT